MTSAAVSPIVQNIISTINKVLKEDASLVGGVKGNLEELKVSLTNIREAVIHAEEKQIVDEGFRYWVRELESAAYDAQDVIDSFATDIFVFKRQNSGIPYQSSYADDIKTVRDVMKVIVDKRGQNSSDVTADGGSVINTLQRSTAHAETTQVRDRVIIQGREDVKEKLISNLLQPDDSGERNVSIYPIVGLPGVGKTTLAQLIYTDARIKDHFKPARMWITVSLNFNLKKILQEIVEVYSDMKETKGLSLDAMKSRFQEFLPGKRFLLILDDVWTYDRLNDWDPLLELLELGSKGSKLVVTSRNDKVAEILVAQENLHFKLDVLSETECWSMFKSIALNRRLTADKKQKLEDLGKEIVGRCGGLPLAVTAMASLLRKEVSLYSWQRILRSNIWDQNAPPILPVLQLSYDNLSSHLKQCFAFCSIFPKAYAFDKIELVKLWMAEAFVSSSDAEDTGATYFDELQERSFFQKIETDKREQYKMHDLIHDLALSVTLHHSSQVTNKDSLDSSKNCRHASFRCQDVEDLCDQAADTWKNLRTVLLPKARLSEKSLDSLFRKLRFLRVLDLSASKLLKLPNSIEMCKLLCYLDLSWTEIKELPNSICELYNLQTLKLVHCVWLLKLPEDFGNLVNLHHLELDEMFWVKCVTLPSKLGSLTKLQNMPTFILHPTEGYGIDELKDMENLKGTLHISMLENAVNAEEAQLAKKEKLRKVVFEWSGRDVGRTDQAAHARVLENIQPHSNLEELHIYHYRGVDFPPWMSGMLRNLVEMSLHHCTNCKILSLGQKPQLQILHVKGLLELEEWADQELFPSLQRLTISKCPKLRLLPSFIPNLRVMKMKRCHSLQKLPMVPSLQFLLLVENFDLKNWNENFFRPTLINLLELKISSCPNLATLPRIFSPQKLEISKCEQLSGLPREDFTRRLQHLALDSLDSGKLVCAIPHSSKLYSLVISNISNMNFLPRWPRLPELKSLYVHNCNDLLSLSEGAESLQSLKSLELLSVRGCPKLETLPSESLPTSLQCLSISSCSTLQFLGRQETLSKLTVLRDLYIEDCPVLKCFPESGLPTSLKHLHIQNCRLLSEACQPEAGLEWQKIMHIPDLETDCTSDSSTHLSSGFGCQFCQMPNLLCRLLSCINPH